VQATKDIPALTNRQLQQLHKRQKKTMELCKNLSSEIVIPAQGDQPGVTRAELQALHERQKRQSSQARTIPMR
jgi:CMP-2-keto-3-deoxyoctulosonic acid synthetase